MSDDPNISAKAFREQFNKLLLQPLESLDSSLSSTTAIVIDALDECEGNDIPLILDLLPQLQKSKVLRVRIFITSRPELPVRLGFGKSDDHRDLDLHELPNPVIEHDIRVFLKERLSMIRKSRKYTDDWPGNGVLESLVMMAVPLFIFAATACRFIEEGRHPGRRIKQLLEAQAVTSGSHMDKIYQPVLTQLLADNDHESTELLQEFQNIVGAIIILATPLPVESLAQLLDLDEQLIIEVLDPLHSVLNISRDSGAPVRILHLSFREYLLTTESEFHVDEQETHRKIGLHCLRVMKVRLKRNICGLSSYGTEKGDINSQIVDQHLSADLQYSCRYWVHHLQQSRFGISEFPILPFLKTNFLHWLEALSWMGVLPEAVGMIDVLQAVVAVGLYTFLIRVSTNAFRRTQILKYHNFYMTRRGSSLETFPWRVLLHCNFIVLDWYFRRNKVLCERCIARIFRNGYVHYHNWKPHGAPTCRHLQATQVQFAQWPSLLTDQPWPRARMMPPSSFGMSRPAKSCRYSRATQVSLTPLTFT
jgi:hypothetical protein